MNICIVLSGGAVSDARTWLYFGSVGFKSSSCAVRVSDIITISDGVLTWPLEIRSVDKSKFNDMCAMLLFAATSQYPSLVSAFSLVPEATLRKSGLLDHASLYASTAKYLDYVGFRVEGMRQLYKPIEWSGSLPMAVARTGGMRVTTSSANTQVKSKSPTQQPKIHGDDMLADDATKSKLKDKDDDAVAEHLTKVRADVDRVKQLEKKPQSAKVRADQTKPQILALDRKGVEFLKGLSENYPQILESVQSDNKRGHWANFFFVTHKSPNNGKYKTAFSKQEAESFADISRNAREKYGAAVSSLVVQSFGCWVTLLKRVDEWASKSGYKVLRGEISRIGYFIDFWKEVIAEVPTHTGFIEVLASIEHHHQEYLLSNREKSAKKLTGLEAHPEKISEQAAEQVESEEMAMAIAMSASLPPLLDPPERSSADGSLSPRSDRSTSSSKAHDPREYVDL